MLKTETANVVCMYGMASTEGAYCHSDCAAFEYPSNYGGQTETATLHCCKRVIQVKQEEIKK